MQQAQSQGSIGAGPKRNPLVGFLGRGSAVWIDADDFGAAALCFGDKMKIDQPGVSTVATPEQDQAGIDRVREFMAAGPEIGRGGNAEHVLQSFWHAVIDASRSGRGAADSRCEAVRRAFGEHSRSAAAGDKSQRAGSVSSRDCMQIFRDDVVGFVPTDALPFAFAAGCGSLERKAQAIPVILVFQAAPCPWRKLFGRTPGVEKCRVQSL